MPTRTSALFGSECVVEISLERIIKTAFIQGIHSHTHVQYVYYKPSAGLYVADIWVWREGTAIAL